MIMTRSFLTAIAILFLAAAAVLHAQQSVSPRTLTTRHIADGTDASATAWNPSLLGIYPAAFELMIGAPIGKGRLDGNNELSLVNMPGYVFGKLGPLGFGYRTAWNNDAAGDSLGLNEPTYYAGIGVPITEKLWLGASLRGGKQEAFFKSAAYTFSGTYRINDALLLALATEDFEMFSGYGAFAPLDWLTLVGSMDFNAADTLGSKPPFRLSAGASLAANDFPIRLELGYEVTRGVTRLGLELLIDRDPTAYRAAAWADIDTSGLMGGAAVARVSTLMPPTVRPLEDDATIARRNPRGWAPNRAYTPAGLYYRYSTNDAAASGDAVVRPCSAPATEFDSPADLMNVVARAPKAYGPLSRRLQELSPVPSDLYKAIRREYYAPTVRNRELMRGDSLQLVTRQGYPIGVQNIDQSKFPEVSMVVQVTDPAGRNVRGLGMNDFRFRDEALKIKSVRPLDATSTVPVDVVIILDCSGSMRDEIQAVRTNVESFVNTMQARGADYRIGGVLYGSVIYDTLHPTSDIATFKKFASVADAIGGDEITTLAIKAATEMNFRPGSQRLFVLITDDWQVQDNALLSEPDVVEMLWNAGARMYTIGNPCSNNGALMTRLSLGREYNITSPFNSILDDIGADVTTLYQIVYDSKMKAEAVTMLRGTVRDETGRPASAPIEIAGKSGNGMIVKPNPTTGEYETEIAEGQVYDVAINGGRYLPFSDQVNLVGTRRGDTVVRNFTLRLPPTVLAGTVTDEKGKPVMADVRIEDAETGERMTMVRSGTDGRYQTPIAEGRMYRLTAVNPDYIPIPSELDARGAERGAKLTQDLKVTSIEAAIANGATFKVNNIFFDFSKAQLKAESFLELNRLVSLLEEYPTIKVEIGAHTDAVGSDRDNQTLSENRARSVVDYLVGKGIVATRLRARGYGKTVPVASNDTEEGRALNRRVEFKLVR